jgi:DNA modification methylase
MKDSGSSTIKSNPMPNWLGVRFTNATETLIWASKDGTSKDYTFRKQRAKEFGIGKVGANVWVLPICMGNERLKDPDGKSVHPAQKPLELMKRIILTTTHMGDLILDPFAGTGTTGFAARRYKRDFIMIEIDGKYAEAADLRMERRKNPKRGDNNPYPELEYLDLRSGEEADPLA